MELIPVKKYSKEPEHISQVLTQVINEIPSHNSGNTFIEANTLNSTVHEIKEQHIIPVFIKDNEPVISHAEFVEHSQQCISDIFSGEAVLKPDIRLSHPVKGRVPGAKNKPASELLEHEKTLYYERMAFTIEIPSVHTEIDGNILNLTVGGVKAYNLDNLYTKSGGDQHFKVFIGFKNMVCTNLCIATDGYLANLKVKNINQLHAAIHALLKDYNAVALADRLRVLPEYELTEQQFANLIGRCRMYKHMPEHQKNGIPALTFGDNQINAVCKDYYTDNSFSRNSNGNINLWKLYNLFTGANKSSYIDNYLDRNVNAYQLISELHLSLEHNKNCWFLN